MTSKIEEKLEELEAYIESCPPKFLSEDVIMVSKSKMDTFIRDLSKRIPEEVEQYRRVLSQKEAIIDNARKNAQRESQQIIDRASKYSDDMVNEHRIMQEAYTQAEAIVKQATDEAQRIIERANGDADDYIAQANAYLDDKLAEIEDVLAATIETTQNRTQSFVLNLQKAYQTIVANRAEINPGQEDMAVVERAEAERLAAEAAMSDELSLDIIPGNNNE